MKVCKSCEETGSPVCLREAFQGEGQILVPAKPGSLIQCLYLNDSLPGGAPDEERPPHKKGEIPPGYRILDQETFLPPEDLLLPPVVHVGVLPPDDA